MSTPRPGHEDIIEFLTLLKANAPEHDQMWLDFTIEHLNRYRDRPDKLFGYGGLTPFGRLIRSIRIINGDRLGDMAADLGIGSAEMSRLETEAAELNPEIIRDIAAYLVKRSRSTEPLHGMEGK